MLRVVESAATLERAAQQLDRRHAAADRLVGIARDEPGEEAERRARRRGD